MRWRFEDRFAQPIPFQIDPRDGSGALVTTGAEPIAFDDNDDFVAAQRVRVSTTRAVTQRLDPARGEWVLDYSAVGSRDLPAGGAVRLRWPAVPTWRHDMATRHGDTTWRHDMAVLVHARHDRVRLSTVRLLPFMVLAAAPAAARPLNVLLISVDTLNRSAGRACDPTAAPRPSPVSTPGGTAARTRRRACRRPPPWRPCRGGAGEKLHDLHTDPLQRRGLAAGRGLLAAAGRSAGDQDDGEHQAHGGAGSQARARPRHDPDRSGSGGRPCRTATVAR